MKRSLPLLIAVVLIAVNILSYQFFVRADMTKGNIYTLSTSTKNIARNLDQNYVIYEFVSKKLPSQFEIINQQLTDALNEYISASKGKLSIKRFDPTTDPEAETLAQQIGVPALQMQVFEKDQTQIVKGYMGLAIVLEKTDSEVVPTPTPEGTTPAAEEKTLMDKVSKFESIPVIQDLSNLEYDITAALKKVSSGSQPVLGFVTGHEEHGLLPSRQDQFAKPEENQDYNYRDVLKKNYRIRDIDLKNAEDVKGVDTIILAGPKTALSDDEIKNLQDFIASGKNALFLLDQVTIGDGLSVTKFEEPYTKLLEPYGIDIKENIVADSSHAAARFSQGLFSYQIPYEYFVKVSGINKDHPITGKLESFVLPWPSSLTIAQKEGVKIDVLATTSNQYLDINENFNLSPSSQPSIPGENKTPLALAVVAQKSGEGKVLIVGDSDFATAQFASQYAGNEVFFLNAIDSFTIGDDLISIRSKQLLDRPIKPAVLQSEALKNLIRWGSMILVPLGFITYGLIRRSMRKAKKRLLMGQ